MGFIGRSENLRTDYARFQETCGILPTRAFSSFDAADPYASVPDSPAFQAARELLLSDQGFARVLCQLVNIDYVCLGIDLPKACANFIRDPSQHRTAFQRTTIPDRVRPMEGASIDNLVESRLRANVHANRLVEVQAKNADPQLDIDIAGEGQLVEGDADGESSVERLKQLLGGRR